jgi:hypothetical protein
MSAPSDLYARCWPIRLIRFSALPLTFTPARTISGASYRLTLTRPEATGTTELADIGDVVVGFKTEAPNARSDPDG